MEYRLLGSSGFKVSALGFGTATFGGKGSMFSSWGNINREQARRLIDICLDHGVNIFDTADIYSDGESEEILGSAIETRREHVAISAKLSLRTGPGPNEVGASRSHLLRGLERTLTRLRTDYIDLLQLHQYDAMTRTESVLSTLTDLVRSGKVRYIGASNFSGWQLMKSLAISEQRGYPQYVAHQVYYSLIGRDYEWELMPLAHDQNISAIVWSPLGWGRLTGRIRRDRPLPELTRLHDTEHFGPQVERERLYSIVDTLAQISTQTGKTIPQIALNWLLQRPTVSTVLIGARNEAQLTENLGAIGWSLSAEHIHKLDTVSSVAPPYPYYHYWTGQFAERAPTPVSVAAHLRITDRPQVPS
jgi:aryl-alcohol dehydrogenase-like predicted oxidoreductase